MKQMAINRSSCQCSVVHKFRVFQQSHVGDTRKRPITDRRAFRLCIPESDRDKWPAFVFSSRFHDSVLYTQCEPEPRNSLFDTTSILVTKKYVDLKKWTWCDWGIVRPVRPPWLRANNNHVKNYNSKQTTTNITTMTTTTRRTSINTSY